MEFQDTYGKYPVSNSKVEVSKSTQEKIDRVKARKLGIGVFDIFNNQF